MYTSYVVIIPWNPVFINIRQWRSYSIIFIIIIQFCFIIEWPWNDIQITVVKSYPHECASPTSYFIRILWYRTLDIVYRLLKSILYTLFWLFSVISVVSVDSVFSATVFYNCRYGTSLFKVPDGDNDLVEDEKLSFLWVVTFDEHIASNYFQILALNSCPHKLA